MPFLDDIKKAGSQAGLKALSCAALYPALYDFTLKVKPDELHNLQTKPVDIWPGNATRGEMILQGRFEMPCGVFDLYSENWSPSGLPLPLLGDVHSFEWLRDIRACKSTKARHHAQALLQSWLAQFGRFEKTIWNEQIAARRVCAWMSHADLFEFDEDIDALFTDTLIRQTWHIFRQSHIKKRQSSYLDRLYTARALIYGAMGFDGHEDWYQKGLDFLKTALHEQILPDGGHISRAPDYALLVLQILLDIRLVMTAGGVECPMFLDKTINIMTPAIRFFRHHDKEFSLFCGTQRGDTSFIDSVLAQAGSRAKAPDSLNDTGFDRITSGRGVLLMDTGLAKTETSSAHSTAPLAFEFSFGKKRILTSCGAHPFDAGWQNALKASAAHNTLTLDHTDPHPRIMTCRHDALKNSGFIQASHDGYLSSHGIEHSRSLYLAGEGQDLRGEDTLTYESPLRHDTNYAIRFHLHPDAQISLVRYGTEALIKFKNRGVWRFSYDGGHLALEDSVYLDQGTTPRKTHQLAIYGQILANSTGTQQFKWALKKEGI